MIWVIFSLITLVVAGALLYPLWKPPARSRRAAFDIEVYKAQLREVDLDAERGALPPEEAAAARLEIERRLLRADRAGNAENAHTKETTMNLEAGSRRLLIPLVIVTVLVGGFFLYRHLGSPFMPDMPMDEREAATDGMSPAQIAGELNTLVENLAARLKKSPNDGDAWRLLSRTYQELGRHGDAAKAFARTAEMFPEDADLRAYEGENLVYEAGGTVIPRALRAFEAALVLDPKIPAARYYVGLARFQAGQYRLAYEGWLALAEATDPTAPWLPDLQRDINEAAAKLGIDAKQIVTILAPTDPPDADPTDAETEEFIRSMVERLAGKLADNPGDADGWMRLGRARAVLGEIDAAAMAYGKAAKLRPKDLEAQLASAHASLKTVPRGTPVPPPVITGFRRVLELDSKNFDGLWFSGLGHLQDGNTKEVRRLWEQALAGLTSDDPRRTLVTDQLDTLRPR